MHTFHNITQVSSRQSELGIGQIDFEYNRFKHINFLPAMYMDELLFASQRPKEITSYDTIVIPFEKYTWIMTFGCIISQFLLLILMQSIWANMTGETIPEDYIYEGGCIISLQKYLVKNEFITDFFLSTEFIPRRRLAKWIVRPGFAIRKVAILKWILLGNILTIAYKTTLLSSLIPIRYEDTIDSINDLDNSLMPLIMMKGSSAFEFFSSTSKPIMKRIFKRSILFSAYGGIPDWTWDM